MEPAVDDQVAVLDVSPAPRCALQGMLSLPANSIVNFTLLANPGSSRTRFIAPLVAGGSLDSGMAGIVVREQWASLV
jgi:hypothetical protein